MTEVTLRVHEDGADDERIEQLTQFLKNELRELAPVSDVPGTAPDGTKAVDLAELGTLLATISQSSVLAALINAVSSWLGQRRERSVTVEADGDPLELTGAPDAAERARRSEWLERRRLRRHALIIASYEFTDPGLSALRAPAHDAARLGEVLGDPRIGGFDVHTMINSSAAEVNEAIEDFFADRSPDDLLVLHFSGHGVKDEAGELHFATSGTKLNRLAGTAVSADFVARRMNRSRSRRIVLLLDCCYSGAFGRGMVARAGGSVGLEEQFSGSGRAVITASSAMEYAFEGAAVADSSEAEPSVFTSALVEGLETGEADRDQDGHVGLDELYEYVYDRVRRVTPHQTPGKWMLDVRGDLHIARRAHPVTVPAALPAELQEAIDHSLPGVRAGAIPELRRMLTVRHEGRVLAARLALRHLAEDDSRMVAAAAREALDAYGEAGEWTELGRPTVPAPTSFIAARERGTGRSGGRASSARAGSSSSGEKTSSARAGSGERASSTQASAASASSSAQTGTGSATASTSTPASPTGAFSSGTAADSGPTVRPAADSAASRAADPAASLAVGPVASPPADPAVRPATGLAAGPAAGTAEAGTGAEHAHAGVPSDREPPHSNLLSGSDTPPKPTAEPAEPTAGPASSPAAGPTTSSAATSPAAGPASSPAAGSAASPVTRSTAGSATGLATSSAAGPTTRPTAGPAGQQAAHPTQTRPTQAEPATTPKPPSRTPDTAASTPTDTAQGPQQPTGPNQHPQTAALLTALPHVIAGLALTMLVLRVAVVHDGRPGFLDNTPPAFALFGLLWPWALVAAMFVLTCRNHPWIPGTALGLLAGTTGLLGGTGETYQWLLLGLAGVVAAVAVTVRPWWLAASAGVLGAAGVIVVASDAGDLAPLDWEGAGAIFVPAVAGLAVLAVYRIWREQAWFSAIAPALLLLDSVLILSADAPQYVVYPSLAVLVVVPLIAALTSGTARFAAYLTVAAGLLLRANDYAIYTEPSFTTFAHALLPLAAAVIAYFSRSR